MSELSSGELLRNHIVNLEADKPFAVELNGSPTADTAVVLVHGFGATRDSRGMFPEIEQSLPSDLLFVRGDFSDVLPNSTEAVPLHNQAERLKVITDYTNEKFNPGHYLFIGHSQGAITVALAHPANSKILLLAPPVDDAFNNFIVTPGWSRPGSVLNLDGESTLQRSDGSVTKVSPEFWQDFMGVNAAALYSQLNQDNDVTIIFAGADQVLGTQEAPGNLANATIESADHDFRGTARKTLLALVRQLATPPN
jgi:hypothetical protein